MTATTPYATVAEANTYFSETDNHLFVDEWFATDLGSKAFINVNWFAAAASELNFTAVNYGVAGNLIEVFSTLIGGTNPPTCGTAGNRISIQYLAGVTAAQCKTALEAIPAFVALATVAISGAGGGAIETFDAFFGGGIDPDPQRLGWRLPALAMATREINYLPFKGQKAVETQANAFPRKYQLPDGSWYTETLISQDIKDACCEEALAIIKYGNSPRTKLREEGVQSIMFGNTGVSERYIGGPREGSMMSTVAMNILRKYMRRSWLMRR